MSASLIFSLKFIYESSVSIFVNTAFDDEYEWELFYDLFPLVWDMGLTEGHSYEDYKVSVLRSEMLFGF